MTEPYEKTKAALQIASVKSTLRAQAEMLRTLARVKADAGDMAMAALLQEQSDALAPIIASLGSL